MAYRLIIRAKAQTDISDAAVWYDGEQAGLGKEFLGELEKCLNRATSMPHLFQRVRRRPDVRRVITQRFPYRVFFVLEDETIVVFRVLHHARDDREWKQNVPKS